VIVQAASLPSLLRALRGALAEPSGSSGRGLTPPVLRIRRSVWLGSAAGSFGQPNSEALRSRWFHGLPEPDQCSSRCSAPPISEPDDRCSRPGASLGASAFRTCSGDESPTSRQPCACLLSPPWRRGCCGSGGVRRRQQALTPDAGATSLSKPWRSRWSASGPSRPLASIGIETSGSVNGWIAPGWWQSDRP